MSERVSVACPPLPPEAAFRIGKPFTSLLGASISQLCAHLLGAQLSQVARMGYGKQELPLAAGTVTYRFRHRAGANVRAIVVGIIPYGYTAGTQGSVQVVGAETLDTIRVQQDGGAIINLDELQTHETIFVKPVTAGAENEHVITCVDLRLHTIVIWEAVQDTLTGAHRHVDRTFGHGDRYITDDAVASNPRGFKAVLNALADARREMRRHYNCVWPTAAAGTGGVVSTGSVAFEYVLGSATASDGLRIYTRSVGGSGVTTTPYESRFYVSAVTAGSTHTIRSVNDAGVTFDVTGVNAAGWWPSTAGAALALSFAMGATDHLKIQTSRTGGIAGDVVRVNSISGWDAMA